MRLDAWRRARAALAMLAAVPMTVAAAPAPDSAASARLAADAARWSHFRVVTHRGEFLVTPLQFDAAGVAVEAVPRRGALIVTPDAAGVPKRVSWADVERIDGRRSRAVRGAVIGALAGGAVGFAAKESIDQELHDAAFLALALIPIGALLGGVTGALVSSTTGWSPLYP